MGRWALVLFVLASACSGNAAAPGSTQTPAISAATVAATAVAGIPREPANLPVFPEEGAVVAALTSAGIHLTLIGGSKFETLLGDRQRARVFLDQPGAGGGGADVLFLDRPIAGVRVCTSRAASGLNRYEIFIGDRLVSSGEGTQSVSFSVNDRYMVQAIGTGFADALMTGLGTVKPPC